MKKCAFLIIASLALMITACSGNKDSDVRDKARESLGLENTQTPPPPVTDPTITPPAGVTDVANASGVQHYICPNNCEGSGSGSAGTCPVCGTAYTHNQAWHNQAGNTTSPPITPPTTPGATEITPPAATNAAGVYHYTCPSGCAGGAGSAGTCATCGATLAHNAAYHQ